MNKSDDYADGWRDGQRALVLNHKPVPVEATKDTVRALDPTLTSAQVSAIVKYFGTSPAASDEVVGASEDDAVYLLKATFPEYNNAECWVVCGKNTYEGMEIVGASPSKRMKLYTRPAAQQSVSPVAVAWQARERLYGGEFDKWYFCTEYDARECANDGGQGRALGVITDTPQSKEAS